MNRLRSLFTDTRFHTFIAVAVLGFLLWHYGPLIQIGKQAPFASPTNRLISLLILALLWGLTNLRSEFKLFKSHSIFDVEHEIKIISRKLKLAQKEIKEYQKNSGNKNATIHWHLVMGPCHAGKTNLLNAALDTDQDRTLVTATQDCAIWHNDDNAYVELGERFLPHHDDPDACRLLFQAFLKLCDKLNIEFHNIIVTVPINQVMTNTIDADITRTQQMLTTLIAKTPKLPITVIFSKCDQMAGFTAFFCDLSMDEREQYCGIRLPFGLTATALKKSINAHLSQLNRRFHDRLLSRLQQEVHPLQRSTMHDFPYQFEIFCSKSLHFLNELLPDCDLNLTGLFFTSSQQTGPSVNHLTAQLSEVFSLQRNTQNEFYTQQTPYFVADLYQHLVPSFAESATRFIRPVKKANPLLVPILAVSLMGFGIYHLYSSYAHHFQVANQMIKSAQIENNHSLALIAEQLATLENTITHLTKSPTQMGKVIRPSQTKALIKKAEQRYDHLIANDFASALDHTLQLKLQQLSQETSGDHLSSLYDTLKIALLLQKPDINASHEYANNQKSKLSPREQLNKAVHDWYENEWQHSIHNASTREILLGALDTALKNPQFSLANDSALIDRARQVLTSSSTDNIIFTILENENYFATMTLGDKTISNSPIKIPGLYTRAAYLPVVNEQIPALCEKFAKGNWILAYHPSQMMTEMNTDELARSVKNRYLKHYLNTWQNALTQCQYTPAQNYHQLVSSITKLNSLESPFTEFVQTVQLNTAAIQGEDDFNEIVASPFFAFNELALEDTNDPLNQALKNLSTYLSPLTQTNSPAQLAFSLTKKRITTDDAQDHLNTLYEIAKQSPEPIKSYITALADNSWSLLINDSRQYLNSVWSNIVLPEYQQHLANHYPFFPQSTADISLDHFANFFAPGGTMDTFFKEYVEAFINNTPSGWQWKSTNGQQFALSDDALATFIRAKLIQKMFFNEGNHHPTANFSLTPTALNADLKNFTLILNGQRVEYHGPNQPPEILSWPGPQQNGVFVEVADIADQKNQMGYPGLWGIFRLLDKAQINSNSTASELNFSWYMNDKRIDCQINSDAPISPFTPGIINQFRCPSSI